MSFSNGGNDLGNAEPRRSSLFGVPSSLASHRTALLTWTPRVKCSDRGLQCCAVKCPVLASEYLKEGRCTAIYRLQQHETAS